MHPKALSSKQFGPFSDAIPTIDNDGYVLDTKEGIRRSNIVKDGPLRSFLDNNLTTIHSILLEAVKRSGNKQFLGSHTNPSQPYNWLTFDEVYTRLCDFGSGLIGLCGLQAGKQNLLGIYGRNCMDWVISELSCSAYNFIGVPLYDTLGVDALKHICVHSALKVCVCITHDRVLNLLHNVKSKHIEHIIVVYPEDTIADLRREAGDKIQVHTFEDILNYGKNNQIKVNPSEPNENILICYTSGTTGLPKGVIITNAMLIATITGCMLNTNLRLFTSNDTHLSYLPLAHIFEQFAIMLALYNRGSVGFFSGDLTRLQEDAYTLKPTVFIAVPRVLARIKQKVYMNVSTSLLKKKLVDYSIYQKLKVVDREIYQHNTCWDRLVLSNIRKRFGGRIRVIITAGAPISGELLQFTRAVFCCPVFEGYGSSEVCGAISCSLFGDLMEGHVGPPLPNCEIKLCDIPELDIVVSRDNKGEVCCKGAVCTPGYYKDSNLTKTLIDEDGWLHTGDVGTWISNSRLKIVDRCKHIFKLSQGEYIAPEKIELIYAQSQYISQVYVDGNALRSYPVALVIPEPLPLVKALNKGGYRTNVNKKEILQTDSTPIVRNGYVPKSQNGTAILPSGDENIGEPANQELFKYKGKQLTLKEICHLPEANMLILNNLHQIGKNAGLKGFEQVRAVSLLPTVFSVENRMLTPTMKFARHAIRLHYKEQLAALFDDKNLD